jgi:hypothetical protein
MSYSPGAYDRAKKWKKVQDDSRIFKDATTGNFGNDVKAVGHNIVAGAKNTSDVLTNPNLGAAVGGYTNRKTREQVGAIGKWIADQNAAYTKNWQAGKDSRKDNLPQQMIDAERKKQEELKRLKDKGLLK